MKNLICLFVLPLLLASCAENPVPKPKGYFRIDLPEKDYRRVSPDCPFSFEIPAYSRIQMRSDRPETCWFNLDFPKNKAQVHFTYKPIENNLKTMLDESHHLSYEHHVKAQDINTRVVVRDTSCVFGLVYYLEGDVASPVQFYLTDSTQHFLRGSLYFNVRMNSDSLQPVISYISEDIDHLISTLSWSSNRCQ